MTTVTSIAELNAAIEAANQTDSGTITITLGNDIFLNGTPLEVINLHAGVTLVIDGGPDGFTTLDGGYEFSSGASLRGLFVYAGKVDINNLTIQDMVVHGGNGGSAGAGGGGGGR
jgi:hypothetical protein